MNIVLNQNSNLDGNIVSISLIHGNADTNILWKWKNNVNAVQLPHYNSKTVLERLSSFLYDTTIWSAHTHSWQCIAFPSGVREMQKALSLETVNLDELQEIALAQLPRQNLPGLFKRIYRMFNHYDDFAKDFYKTVINAKSLYEVVQWIDVNSPIARLRVAS